VLAPSATQTAVDLQLPNTPVPMFPLPGVFLFPHQVLPLHVFEPRYRELVADLLDGPGRFVVATTQTDERETPEHVPEVLPVAGLGESMRHEQLPDGRYMIWVLGLARVHLEEVDSDRQYRRVMCRPFVEIAVPAPDVGGLARKLREAPSARLAEPLPLPESTPPGLLADLLLQALQAPRDIVERAFAEPDVSMRARLALREARRKRRSDASPDDDSGRDDSGGGHSGGGDAGDE
jgi:hypothetical protein